MKKFLILLLFLLFLPTLVKAEVKITNVEIVDNTKGLEVSKPTFEGLKLNVDINFKEIEDFVKYKLTINNDTKKDYEINVGTEFSKGEYIKYEYTLDSDGIVKKGTEKDVYLTITYNKLVPYKELINGKFNEKNNMIINLSNEEKNPKTSVGIYVLIAILCLVISTSLILLIKNKMNTIPLTIFLLLLIPVSIYALEKLTIEIDTNITIVAKENKLSIYNDFCGWSPRKAADIEFTEGMTFEDFINSDYSNQLGNDMKDALIERDIQIKEITIEHVKCTEQVEYVEWNVNMTEEEQQKRKAYYDNVEYCNNKFAEPKDVNIKDSVIKNQDEIVYKFVAICE